MHQRRLIAAVIVIVLIGGTIGSLELRSTSHFIAKQPLTSAFAKAASAESGGRPTMGLDGFDELQFIPSARFPIGIVLTNESSLPVTLTDVRAVLPHASAIRQLGTALVALHPYYCPANQSCPAPPGGISSRNYGAIRPAALRIAPGEEAGVQLNFRLLGCPQARHASLRNVSRVEISYRDPAGAILHQRVALGGSTLRINTPHPCVP
jgi:hypothetical protein